MSLVRDAELEVYNTKEVKQHAFLMDSYDAVGFLNSLMVIYSDVPSQQVDAEDLLD